MSSKSLQEQLKILQPVVQGKSVVSAGTPTVSSVPAPVHGGAGPSSHTLHVPPAFNSLQGQREIQRLKSELLAVETRLRELLEQKAKNDALEQSLEIGHAQLLLDKKKVSDAENYALDEAIKVEKTANDLERDRLILADGQEALTKSLVRHAEELQELKTLKELREKVNSALLRQQAEKADLDANRLTLETKAQELADRESKLVIVEGMPKQIRKLESALRGSINDLEFVRQDLLAKEKLLQKVRTERLEFKRQGVDLREQVSELVADKSQLEKSVARLDREKSNLKERFDALKRLTEDAAELTIKSIKTVSWMTENFDREDKFLFDDEVLMMGEGPWDWKSYQHLLTHRGFDVYRDDSVAKVEVLILGRDGWSKTALMEQLEARAGKRIRVFSQELFILALALNFDPLESEDEATLLRLVENHPAFEYLLGNDFPWPASGDGDGTGEFTHSGADHSPLFELGYSVAKMRGLAMSQRHSCLEQAFTDEQLPWVLSDGYMSEWGDGGTRLRLQRIAWHISMLTRTHNQHVEAVAKWESDLLWLRVKYYNAFMRFSWPK